MRESNPEQFIEKALEAMIPAIKEVYKEHLLMIALYGSAATGTFVKGVSDINILIVVDLSDAEKLCDLSKSARRSLLDYRITPHILSERELLTSADVFPIEYLEIRDTLRLLYGTSLLDELEIGKKNIRHQVETMLRGELNSLRQILLMTSCEEKILHRELLSWSGRQLPLYRAVLRLYGDHTAIMAPKQMITLLEKYLQCPCSSLKELVDLRKKKTKMKSPELRSLSTELVTQYLKMVEVVDACDTVE